MKQLRKFCRSAALDVCSVIAKLQGKFQMVEKDNHFVEIALLHRIQPHEEEQFDRFIGWLVENFNTVSYGNAARIIQSGDKCGPSMAISFDDGFKDNLRAAEILQRHGVSGCFFVCPSIVGEIDGDVIRKFSFENLQKTDVRSFMDWDDLARLRNMGHEIGNHSMDHLYLMSLSNDEFCHQVGKAREILDARIGATEHFSWPFGRYRHLRPDQIQAVFDLGHTTCASGERGVHRVQSDQTDAYSRTIRRNTVDMAWPLRHSQYFLTRNL